MRIRAYVVICLSLSGAGRPGNRAFFLYKRSAGWMSGISTKGDSRGGGDKNR